MGERAVVNKEFFDRTYEVICCFEEKYCICCLIGGRRDKTVRRVFEELPDGRYQIVDTLNLHRKNNGG